jgi:hypothetical protein
MNALSTSLAAFTVADVATVTGLPGQVLLDDLAPFLTIARDDRSRGQAGTPAQGRSWVAAEAPAYDGGVLLWLDEVTERVVVVEGLSPRGHGGLPFLAPELGDPDAVFDAVLGPVLVRGAERVFADRGLALHVFPETGALIRVLVFAPTTVEGYRTRLQPHHEPLRKLPGPVSR